MANLTAEQVEAYIRKSRDEERKTWPQIADELKKKGYKSPKTSKPLAEASVRYIYFYGANSARKNEASPASEAAAMKLNMIKTALKMKSDDKTRVAMITQIIDSD